MTKCTLRKVAAGIIAAAVCISSASARAAESQPSAAPVADAGANRPVVLRTTKVGGVRSGETVVVTERGAERVSPAEIGGAQCVVAGAGQGG